MKYEKSYKKVRSILQDDPVLKEIQEYELKITKDSVRRIEWMLEFAEKLADMCDGVIKVSYDESRPIRHYVISVIANSVVFFNSYIKEQFINLLKDVELVAIRTYQREPDKIELIIIQCNADEIYSENTVL